MLSRRHTLINQILPTVQKLFGGLVESVGAKSYRFRELVHETTIQDNAVILGEKLCKNSFFHSG